MLPIPTTSFSGVFGEMTSCDVHYDVIYQFSIFEDFEVLKGVDSPAIVSIFRIISFILSGNFYG